MKAKNISVGTVLFLGLALTPVFSASAAETKGKEETRKSDSKLTEQFKTTRFNAQRLLAEISLISMALNLDLKPAALEHLESAKGITEGMKKNAATWKNDTSFKYGKVSYSVNDEEKDFYVPISEGSFVIRDYQPVFRFIRPDDVKETDVRVVNSEVLLDLRSVEKGLLDAQKDIEAGKLKVASQALEEIFKNAVTDTNEVESPAWAVYDYLSLAKGMIQNKRYDSARHALKNAKSGLAELEKEDALSGTVQKIRAQVENMENELKQKDPTTLTRMENTVHGWMEKVKSWV